MKRGFNKFAALSVRCPKCGANVGSSCARPNGVERIAFHTERHSAARTAPPTRSKFWRRDSKGYGKEWASLRAKVFASKGAQCVYCGLDASHVDHRTPKARGGTDALANLEPCCAACNISKGKKTVEEWQCAQ